MTILWMTGLNARDRTGSRVREMRRLRFHTLLAVTIVSLTAGVLGVNPTQATILGGVPYNNGVRFFAPQYAWTSTEGPGVEGICHLSPNAITGWNSWSFSLPFTETRWRCMADGRDALPSGVAVGSTVDFKKLEIEQIVRLGNAAPDMRADYPRVITRARWDLGRDGSFESDTSSGWLRDQDGQSCAANYEGTWWCWTRAYYLHLTHRFDEVGDVPVALVVNYDDGTTETATGTVPIVPDAVTPSATVSRAWYLTGDPITVDAQASTSVSGSIASFTWDLGDGAFGPASGSARQTTSFSTSGMKTVRVRIASRGGSTADASANIEVRPAPPSGEPGVSVNDGAQFTNDSNVLLWPVWPAGATAIRVSNDGGFRRAQTLSLGETVAWALDGSGEERLPKTVYARFSGSGIDESKTYQDDIILDQTPPKVVSATAVVVKAAGAKLHAEMVRRTKTKSRTVRVRTKATDALSGVAAMQVTDNKRAPSAARPYAVSATLRTKKTTVFVRAQDRAGNWSVWRSVRVKAKASR